MERGSRVCGSYGEGQLWGGAVGCVVAMGRGSRVCGSYGEGQ